MKYEITSRRLKEALNDNNMKPQELADASGVNKSSISQYINGSHAPSNTSSGRMASVLHVSPLWLMGFDAPKYEAVPAATISSLTEEEMAVALGYRKADENIKNGIAGLLGIKRKESSGSSTIREEKIG